ncbi:MAG: hypothetical protein HRF43_13190, partial [Phycisphaerae bacterium]
WAHSPVWSPSGRAVAFVVNEPPFARIVHLDLSSGDETLLGLAEAVHCQPRFDGDDRTLLFSAGPAGRGPFRVYRQRVGEGPPAPLTPEGRDCFLPLLVDDRGGVICASNLQGPPRWVRATLEGATDLTTAISGEGPEAVIGVCAGVAEPVSPDRRTFAYYDAVEGRVAVCDFAGRRTARHIRGSIAACWIDPRILAVATPDNLFAVDAFSGVRVALMSGAWVPARFVPASRTLIAFGLRGKGAAPTRLTIYRMVLEPVGAEPARS